MHEVELKLALSAAEGTSLLQRFQEALGPPFWEEDTYFTSPLRDFIASEECLRVRRREGFSEITWKPSTTAEMRFAGQYWKEEINLSVDPSSGGAVSLLTALGFEEYVTVSKLRRCARIDDATSLVVDVVSNLGWFAEIETMSDRPVEARLRNEQLAATLGLHSLRPVTRPYRDLVKEAELHPGARWDG